MIFLTNFLFFFSFFAVLGRMYIVDEHKQVDSGHLVVIGAIDGA